MDKTINTLEGFLYQQLLNGVSKETLQEFLMDELQEAVDLVETENAYATQMKALADALAPFYAFICEDFPSLKGRITREKFEESLMNFLLKLQRDPAYVKLFLSTFTGEEVPKVEVSSSDKKVIYNFLKSNNLN